MRQSKQIIVDRCVHDRLYLLVHNCFYLITTTERKENEQLSNKMSLLQKKQFFFSLSLMLFLCRHLTEDKKKLNLNYCFYKKIGKDQNDTGFVRKSREKYTKHEIFTTKIKLNWKKKQDKNQKKHWICIEHIILTSCTKSFSYAFRWNFVGRKKKNERTKKEMKNCVAIGLHLSSLRESNSFCNIAQHTTQWR